MSFESTIADICGEDLVPCDYRFTVTGRSVYCEGVRRVVSFKRDEVILGTKKSALRIAGEELFIESFSSGDAVIKGRVRSVEKM